MTTKSARKTYAKGKDWRRKRWSTGMAKHRKQEQKDRRGRIIHNRDPLYPPELSNHDRMMLRKRQREELKEREANEQLSRV